MNSSPPSIRLTWANKETPPPPLPAKSALQETFAPLRGMTDAQAAPDAELPANALIQGDNLGVLAQLLADGWAGRFRLIYADPPYNSGLVWMRKVRLRGPQRSSAAAVVEQQPQYTDAWDESAYLQFLYARLLLMRELLAEDGSLWLHCDYRHAHHLRCLLEELFGPKQFLNTITWRSQTVRGAKVNAFYFANSAHALHIFAKNRSAPTCWTPAKKRLILSEAQAAAQFMRDERGFFRTSDPGDFSFASLERLHAEGRLYAPYGGVVLLDADAQRAYCSNGGNIGVKYYLTALGDGRYAVERGVDNIWEDIPGLGTTPGEDMGYPTQKTEALLSRIIHTATRPGDWVLDPFMGSGTTPAVAQKLGRRWVGCDGSLGALQTARRRLHAIIQAQPLDSTGRGFAVYCAEAPGTSRPPGAPDAPDAPAPSPQVHLVITPIAGEAARIRVTVEQVRWPPAQAALLGEADWRAAVDAIAIDPAYDGRTLRVALADGPLKRAKLVAGDYTLPAQAAWREGARIAVRVTDIWGQETLAVQDAPDSGADS